MDYTTQVQIIIDIKTLLSKHNLACYNEHDTTFKEPEHTEFERVKGYEVVYHDNLPNMPYDYQNLTFTIEGKTCGLVNHTHSQKDDFHKWNGLWMPDSEKLCEFIDNKIFRDEIDFESKGDFQAILNEYFEYEHYRRKDVMRQVREISVNLSIPTPPQPAEVTGYDLGYSDTQLECLHGKLIEGKFIHRNTELENFKNAFNGEVLAPNFKPLKWSFQYYASLFVTHQIEHKTPWKIAERVFNNGTSDCLKNAYKDTSDMVYLSDNQKNAKKSIDKIMESLR